MPPKLTVELGRTGTAPDFAALGADVGAFAHGLVPLGVWSQILMPLSPLAPG